MRYAREGLIAVVLALVVWENVATVSRLAIPSGLPPVARAIAMDQSWHLYAPEPGRYNFRVTVLGLRSDSTLVTLDDWGESTTWRPLERFRGDYRSKSYLEIVATLLAPAELQALGAWACRLWNESHDPAERVIAVAFTIWEREILLHGSTAPPSERVLQEEGCP